MKHQILLECTSIKGCLLPTNQFKRTSSGIFLYLPGWSVMQSERISELDNATFFMVDSNALEDVRGSRSHVRWDSIFCSSTSCFCPATCLPVEISRHNVFSKCPKNNFLLWHFMAFDDSLEVLDYAHFDEFLSLWRLGKKAHTQKVNTSSCSDIVVLTFTSHSIHFRIFSFLSLSFSFCQMWIAFTVV